MIQGIFYARFLPQEGTKIVAQAPPGCIVPADGVSKPPLFDFDVLQEYIIPRPAFFNRYITVNDPEGKYHVLSFPVSIADRKYHRNEFIFNFGVVVEADVDHLPYERVVRRLAETFAEMEKQSEFLSGDGVAAGDASRISDGEGSRRPIESLLEIVREDLNNYGECMIPVDDANTINMKLFPHHPNPPLVKGWHVPVPKLNLADAIDPTWDLTLQKLIPHIDGVSDVRRIAWAADVSLELTQIALRHLLYYDTIILLDLFFFGSCYAPRPAVHDFIADVGGVQDECAAYVCVASPSLPPSSSSAQGGGGGGGAAAGGSNNTGATGSGSRSGSAGNLMSGQQGGGGGAAGAGEDKSATGAASSSAFSSGPPRISGYDLVRLMSSFCPGRSVAEWLKTHMDSGFDVLRYVDVRRLVQFGVIKGYLYRVHKYVVSKQYLAAVATGLSRPQMGADPLQMYTDGQCCFDQIITENNLTDGEIVERLKRLRVPQGDLTVFYK